jgi:hypothetical protein
MESVVDNVIESLRTIKKTRPNSSAGDVSVSHDESREIVHTPATKKSYCPDKKTTLRPACFNNFDIRIFTTFVKTRCALDEKLTDVLLLRNSIQRTIVAIKNLQLSLLNENKDYFSGVHIAAYFYYKVANKVIYQDRLQIIDQFGLDIKANDSHEIYIFKKWGKLLSHGSKLQWIAGIPGQTLTAYSISNWSFRFSNKELDTNDVEIDGISYSVPY